MGAIKDNSYTEEEWISSNFSRAFSHPARRRIVRQLLREPMNNISLSMMLNLNRKTVREHLDKLQDANVIGVTYMPHFYIVYLNEDLHEAIETQLKIYNLINTPKLTQHIR